MSTQELMAIIWEDEKGIAHKVDTQDCFQAVYPFPLHETLTLDNYLHSELEEGHITGFTLLYGSEGIPETNEGCEQTFGKICDHCHSTLSAWYVCKHCGVIEWFDNGHTCSAFPLENEKDYEDEWQLTEFDEDQL